MSEASSASAAAPRCQRPPLSSASGHRTLDPRRSTGYHIYFPGSTEGRKKWGLGGKVGKLRAKQRVPAVSLFGVEKPVST